MKRFKLVYIFCLFLTSPIFSQSWTFNNNSLNNWSTVRISATTGTSHLTLTTTGQGNPKLKHSSPAIDADSNSYQIATSEQEVIQNDGAFNVLSTLKFIGKQKL